MHGKKSQADKEMRVLALQQELEHIKEMVMKKEARGGAGEAEAGDRSRLRGCTPI